MADYKPKPFNVPFVLLTPTLKSVEGVNVKTFEETDLIYASFRTFGGSERVINNVWSIEKTGTIDTWYIPHITADCRLKNANTGDMYEIVNEPENIDSRNQFLQFKVRKIGGTP